MTIKNTTFGKHIYWTYDIQMKRACISFAVSDNLIWFQTGAAMPDRATKRYLFARTEVFTITRVSVRPATLRFPTQGTKSAQVKT